MPVQDVLDSLKQIDEIHRKKNSDYSTTSDPLSNFRVAEYGISLFSHPNDQVFTCFIFTKLARLSVLLSRSAAPNNESIEDSFIDIATYVLLWKASWKDRMKPVPVYQTVTPISHYVCQLHQIIDCAECQREGRDFYWKD